MSYSYILWFAVISWKLFNHFWIQMSYSYFNLGCDKTKLLILANSNIILLFSLAFILWKSYYFKIQSLTTRNFDFVMWNQFLSFFLWTLDAVKYWKFLQLSCSNKKKPPDDNFDGIQFFGVNFWIFQIFSISINFFLPIFFSNFFSSPGKKKIHLIFRKNDHLIWIPGTGIFFI